MKMKLVSVNTGLPREVTCHGRQTPRRSGNGINDDSGAGPKFSIYGRRSSAVPRGHL